VRLYLGNTVWFMATTRDGVTFLVVTPPSLTMSVDRNTRPEVAVAGTTFRGADLPTSIYF